jgi:hypothetical protein
LKKNIRCVSFFTSKFIALEEANNCTFIVVALVLVAEKIFYLITTFKVNAGANPFKTPKIKGFSRWT